MELTTYLEGLAGEEHRPARERGALATAVDLIWRQRKALQDVEFAGESDHPHGGTYPACPSCDGAAPDNRLVPAEYRGHADGCALADVLDYGREAEALP